MTKKTVFVSFFILCAYAVTAAHAGGYGIAEIEAAGVQGESKLTKQVPDPAPEGVSKISITKKINKITTKDLAYGDLLKPDLMYDVPLSVDEINRISADDEIKTIKYKKDVKGIAIDYEGSDAFIIYDGKKPFLAYVVTDSAVYHVRFVPSRIPATYYILSEKSVAQKGSTEFASSKPALKGNSMEARLVEMVKHAYRNDPQGGGNIEVKPLDHIIKTKELEFFSYKKYKFQEDNIFVKVILVRTRKNYAQDSVSVREKDFIFPELMKYPVAIAVENHSITKNEFTRVFLVGADYNMRASL